VLCLAAAALMVLVSACSGLVPPATPTRSVQEVRGQQVFEAYCARCHGTVGETVVVGPSLAGIVTRGGQRMQDMDAETYIRSSILDPSAYTVEGFPDGAMPGDLKDELSEEDLEAVIAYLMTLK
jgi:mono/diheme cytochrome c family protein